jgi:hypothetical protein
VSIIPNTLIINQLSRADTQSFISKENYPPSRDGAFVSDRYTECVAMTMGIKIDQSSFLDGLKGEFVGNCYDLQIAFNKIPPSLNQISEHFIDWQKAQGINHVSEYSYSKETYKNHFIDDGVKLSRLFNDYVSFFNAVPSLNSRLRYIETSASEPHPYIRFWHGYQILTRPILAYLGIEALRFISGCFFILSLGLIAYFLNKKEKRGGGIIGGLFLILMLISLDIKEIITNYIHAVTLSAMFLSSLATVYFNRAHQKILAGFWGMYFSFLLNIQIGLIMVFWLSWVAYQPKSLTIKEYKPLFKNTILWFIGILFSFFYKYGLVSFIFFNQNNISLFTDAVWDRSFAGHNTATEFVYDYFAMLGSNLKFWSF